MPPDPPPTTGRFVVRGACPHDCPDTCAMLVTVEDGRAVEVRGAPDHPPTHGTLCTKVARYLERTYATDRVLHPMRRIGRKGEGRFARISWDEALDTIAGAFARDRGGARSGSNPALQLRRQHGPSAVRLDGSPFLPSARCHAARSHDLRVGRQGGLGVGRRRGDGHGRRALRRSEADPDLGQQRDRLQPALLDARAGSQAARREAGRDRSLPQRDGRKVSRARRADARHRCGTRLRADARADPRRPGRSRLRRSPHRRLRRARRARRGVDAGARRGDLRHPGRAGGVAGPRLWHDAAGGDPAELRHAARRRRRQRRSRRGLPAGAHRRVARSGGRRAAVVVGHLSGRLTRRWSAPT